MSEAVVPTLIARWGGLSASISARHEPSASLQICRWQHSLPAFDLTELEISTIVLTRRPNRSHRHLAGRRRAFGGARGTLALVPAGTRGSWTFEGPVDVLHLYLPAPPAATGGRPALTLPDEEVDDPLLKRLVARIDSMMGLIRPSALALDTVGTAVHEQLARRYGHGPPPRNRRLAPWQVRRIRDLLEARLAEGVALDRIAGEVGLSAGHVVRAFKAATGLPPHRYLTEARIDRATRLLTDTDMPISDIAETTGFPDQSYFGRLFRQRLGVTPSGYRRQRDAPAAEEKERIMPA